MLLFLEMIFFEKKPLPFSKEDNKILYCCFFSLSVSVHVFTEQRESEREKEESLTSSRLLLSANRDNLLGLSFLQACASY